MRKSRVDLRDNARRLSMKPIVSTNAAPLGLDFFTIRFSTQMPPRWGYKSPH